MTRTRRTALSAALCGALALMLVATARPAWADGFPDKPIRIVVPYAPGGPTDIVARLVGNKMATELGQPVLIENKGGAGGNLGAELVARAPADGYTLLLVTSGHTINPALYPKLSYSLKSDLVGISQLISTPMVVAVNPSLPVSNLRELIALAKAQPGQLNFASAGNGSSTHLAAELFDMMAGVKMGHVPYKGSSPALSDVMAGHVQVAFDYMISAMPYVRSGKLKGLAVTGSSRSSVAPELPTVAEAGLPGYEVISWNGLMAPANTPKAVLVALNAAVKSALASPELVQQISAQGSSPQWSSPEVFGNFVSAEIERWGKVVRASGAKID